MYWYFRPTLRHLSGYPAIRGTNGSYPSGDEHQGGEDPLPCPPRARTRQKPGTPTRCPVPANPQLTRKAQSATGHDTTSSAAGRTRSKMRPSLTALSQTGESSPDTDALTGLPTDPDLHNRTPADSPDTRHETTDQKIAVQGALTPRHSPSLSAPAGPRCNPVPARIARRNEDDQDQPSGFPRRLPAKALHRPWQAAYCTACKHHRGLGRADGSGQSPAPLHPRHRSHNDRDVQTAVRARTRGLQQGAVLGAHGYGASPAMTVAWWGPARVGRSQRGIRRAIRVVRLACRATDGGRSAGLRQ